LFERICHNEGKNNYFCEDINFYNMKSIVSGLIIFGIMASAACSFVSCSCNRGKEEVEMDDSTKTALEMERKRMEEPEFEIKTTHGTMKLRLYSKTPKHRENFVKLVAEKYYDSLRFHRVIDGFMIQGGDPFSRDTALINRWGTGGPDYTIPAEFVPEYRHKKGALAAARKGDMANPTKASSGSQFYIVQDEFGCSHLDGDYTVYGEVYEGLEVIDAIASVATDYQNRPREDVMIISIKPIEE
jgi:cyclophilin family peptidyl-prolyl cis-trans isomerase